MKREMKTKNGFTLIELLAVIIILAIIALIATPIILDVVEDARKSAGLSEANMIYSSINNYCTSVEMKKQMGTITSEDVDCSTKTTFKDEEIRKMVNLGNVTVEENAFSNGKLTNLVVISNKYKYVLCSNGNMALETDGCEENTPEVTVNEPNEPELLDNMVPIYYDGSNWKYADVSQEWYDYDKKEWANAVVLNSDVTKNIGDTISEDEIALWYVWIPRYTYTIFNGNNESVNEQEIQIKFESGINSSGTVKCIDAISGNGDSSETCTDATNGSIVNGTSTYTHPAFTFGDEQLTGFWVGKFEISGNVNQITIKPNEKSLKSQTVSSFFNSILNIKTVYNLNGDSHMMKNMEWGAVAYLSHSKYGTCTDGSCSEVSVNSNTNYYTGGGNSNAYKQNVDQSTTKNIYGVYDMNGGSYEFVMGNMVNSNGQFYSNSSGFSTPPESKYYDSYTFGYSNYGSGKLGDATKETMKKFGNGNGGWYNDFTYFLNYGNQWFRRGGYHYNDSSAGIFYFYRAVGSSDPNGSARCVLSVIE